MITDPKESRLLANVVNRNNLDVEQKIEISQAALDADTIQDLPEWIQELAAKTPAR